MHQSAVPPPLARSPCWCGDQAMAFTAAMWLLNLAWGDEELWIDQTRSLLSLPPDASYYSSKLHLRPHTSYLCPTNLASKLCLLLRSQCKILLSLDPELKHLLFQATVPMRPSCPGIERTSLHF